MINYKEIFDAWKISFNPNKEQEELAEKRLAICTSCEFRQEILKGVKWSAYCGACGCPLSKKVFSRMYNACQKKKWEIIDSEYINLERKKDNNTII